MWVERAIWNGLTITDHILQVKAKEFADRFGITEFNASAGWITNFKRRNSLSSYRRRGEIGSAPLQDIPRYRDELQTLLQNYELKNIFNCDELALYWRLEPSKTLAYAPVLGKKKPKDRITLLITCNATGDEKLPLVFVHKYETPRALRGIDKATLPVWYYWNKKCGCREAFLIIFYNNLMNR